MTKRTRNILLGIILFLIIVNAVSFIARKRSDSTYGGNSAGRITQSAISVRINGEAIPAYSFKHMVYIAAEDLQLFNFIITKNDDEKTCNIVNIDENYEINKNYRAYLSYIEDNSGALYRSYKTYFDGNEIQGYSAGDYLIIPVNSLEYIGTCVKSDSANVIEVTLNSSEEIPSAAPEASKSVSASVRTAAPESVRVIVLDPGHGLSSQYMSDDEKRAAGWVYNEARGQWGEWRHWKSGTVWEECGGSGCSGRVPEGGGCWYPIENGDRDTEPDINLQNCLSAKKYLEEMGYTVRLTRSSNSENPSITERIKSCYPNKDTSRSPDALAYVCVHSNAGGGSGSAYISLGGTYDQSGIPANYTAAGNSLGKAVNDRIVSSTDLSAFSGGCIENLEELILFCKSPVICGYLEIGFFDNSSDLAVLKSESDAIGCAIAEGINDYFGN